MKLIADLEKTYNALKREHANLESDFMDALRKKGVKDINLVWSLFKLISENTKKISDEKFKHEVAEVENDYTAMNFSSTYIFGMEGINDSLKINIEVYCHFGKDEFKIFENDAYECFLMYRRVVDAHHNLIEAEENQDFINPNFSKIG